LEEVRAEEGRRILLNLRNLEKRRDEALGGRKVSGSAMYTD